MQRLCAPLQIFSIKHKSFRAARCTGFDPADGTHQLTDFQEPAAQVGNPLI